MMEALLGAGNNSSNLQIQINAVIDHIGSPVQAVSNPPALPSPNASTSLENRIQLRLDPSQFQILENEHIGEGGCGVVYKAVLKISGIVAAAKILDRSTPRKVLEREINNWLLLSHPRIHQCLGYCLNLPPNREVVIFSKYHSKGNVTEYVKNADLSDFQRIRLISGIAEGMRYLHDEADILHGDLKGSNILVNDDGEPLITDFGTARLCQATITKTVQPPQTQRGTRMWQSPERLLGKSLTKAMDIYAFAMTCYEIMSNGEPPFGWILDSDLVRLVTKENRRPDIPPAVQGSIYIQQFWPHVEECWTLEPFQRPPFKALVQELAVLTHQKDERMELVKPAGGYGFCGELDKRRLSIVNSYLSPYDWDISLISGSQPTSATQMFFTGGVTSFAADPSEMMSTNAPSSIGFPLGQWSVSQLRNQVARGNGYDGELDAVNSGSSVYYSALSSIPDEPDPDYKLSSFAYMEDSQQRRLDPKGWRLRSSKSERRIYWFQFTQNEGSWFLEVNLRTREIRKIEPEEEFERLRCEEELKSEEDREHRFIKFNNLPRFWIREKTNSSREILPLNKNDFGEFIKCCSLFYGNCSSNGHRFLFYEISDKSCICDEGQEDKLVRLKKQPFKRPSIIADHVAECLRFRETGFGELCKVKKGWADEDRENGGGGMEDDEDEIDERVKKALPKRKNNGKPSLGQQSKFKVESSPNTIA